MKITVFIPTYNTGEVLRDTLDSVISQSYRDLEIIITDDSSTDGLTRDIIVEYAARDNRIRAFVKPHEGIVPCAWRYVMPMVSGEFILYMSHDDIIAPDAVEKAVEKAREDPETDHVLMAMTMFRDDPANPEPEYETVNRRNLAMAGRGMITGAEAFTESLDYHISGFGLWRTSLVKRYPVPTDTFNGDDFMHRIWRLHCRKVAFCSGGFFYRQSPTGILRGHRVYHYQGLRVHNRLAVILDSFTEITGERRSEVIYNWYKWLRQFSAWYTRHRNDYTTRERRVIKAILRESHSAIGSRLGDVPPGLAGGVVRLTAGSYILFRLLSVIDKPD